MGAEKNFVPLAVYRSDQVPNMYKALQVPEGLTLDSTRFIKTGDGVKESFTVVPLLGRVLPMETFEVEVDGLWVSRMDTSTAAALARSHTGWVGQAKVVGDIEDQVVNGVLIKRVAQTAEITNVAPYCTDTGAEHNNTLIRLSDHIRHGRNARESYPHGRVLRAGVLFEREDLLIPHCGKHMPSGLNVVYEFKRAEGQIIVSKFGG